MFCDRMANRDESLSKGRFTRFYNCRRYLSVFLVFHRWTWQRILHCMFKLHWAAVDATHISRSLFYGEIIAIFAGIRAISMACEPHRVARLLSISLGTVWFTDLGNCGAFRWMLQNVLISTRDVRFIVVFAVFTSIFVLVYLLELREPLHRVPAHASLVVQGSSACSIFKKYIKG